MKYVHALEGSLIAFVILILITILAPGAGPSEEVKIILTITTFLFAILLGFFLNRLNSRYNDIRRLVAEEDAYFLSFYKTSQFYGKKFADRIKNLIDKYYVCAYDFTLSDYSHSYRCNSKYFLQMWDELRKHGKNYKKQSTYSKLTSDLTSIEKCRNTSSVISSEKLGYGQWFTLLILSGIILFSLFYLKTDELYSQIITILLSTGLLMILLILRDLQNLMLGGKSLLVESGQEVLELIGCIRYYNEIQVKNGISYIPEDVKVYRLGLHSPGSEKLNIKIVRK